jgi:hypothetical protein
VCSGEKAEGSLGKVAKNACLPGDFRKGAEVLTQLQIDTDDPTYLFNLGRCYEQNHQWLEALDAFREYKRKASKLTKAEVADTGSGIRPHRNHTQRQGEQPRRRDQPAPQPAQGVDPIILQDMGIRQLWRGCGCDRRRRDALPSRVAIGTCRDPRRPRVIRAHADSRLQFDRFNDPHLRVPPSASRRIDMLRAGRLSGLVRYLSANRVRSVPPSLKVRRR